MVTTLSNLETDLPFLEGSLEEYGQGSFEYLKTNHLDKLLSVLGGLHLSGKMIDVPINEIMPEIQSYLSNQEELVLISKRNIDLTFYDNNAENIIKKKETYMAYKEILEKKVNDCFSNQNKEKNKPYVMFIDKIKYITSAIDMLSYLEGYKDNHHRQIIADNIAGLHSNIVILQDLQDHFSALGITKEDHPMIKKIDDFIKKIQSVSDERPKFIHSLYRAEEFVEGTLIPYVISPSGLENSTQTLHQLLGLDNPSSDIKKIALLQERLINTSAIDQKLVLFTEIQDLFIDIYHKLYCVASPQKGSFDKKNLVLSPENTAYPQISEVKDALIAVYNNAQSFGGDLSQKHGKISSLFDSHKKKKEELLSSIRLLYPYYLQLDRVLKSHNKGIEDENIRTLEQLLRLDAEAHSNASLHYSHQPLDSTIADYFQKYINGS